MRAPVSPTYPQGLKWSVSHLTMRSAYKWDQLLPPVEDPDDILTFLDYHFQLVIDGVQDLDEPIQNALSALGYASSPVTVEALKRLIPTQAFFHGICYAFDADRPLQLRKAALFLLPLISNFFDARHPFIQHGQINKVCVGWASTASNSIGYANGAKRAILAGLFGMISSPFWRPHIVAEGWEFLGYFPSVPDDPPFLKRCIDDPELINFIGEVENPRAIEYWLVILWLKSKELTPRVRERLEEVTKERAQDGRTGFGWYVSERVCSELKIAEEALAKYGVWSSDPVVVALRQKISDLREARASILSLTRGHQISP